jgi:hypothetical protein
MAATTATEWGKLIGIDRRRERIVNIGPRAVPGALLAL